MDIACFAAAGGLAAVWLLIHLFWGGRDVLSPLLAATTLEQVVRQTHYLCWHFTSVAIACIPVFFVCAIASGERSLATAGTILAGGFFLVGVALVVSLKGDHGKLPQGWLFLPVALLGVLGHIA